jgi:hypothetical protein
MADCGGLRLRRGVAVQGNVFIRFSTRKDVSVNAAERSQQVVALTDPAARMFALTRIIAVIEQQDGLESLIAAGITPEMAERLRGMSMGEAYRFVLGHCGLAISVDAGEMGAQMTRLERQKGDRELLEYLVTNGASPRLLTQLFSMAPDQARRMRKMLAPHIAAGGRPKVPDADERDSILEVWEQLSAEVSCMRTRFRLLHERFSGLLICSLEMVVSRRTEQLV